MAIRDRLAVLAAEQGTTIEELVEALAAAQPTQAEYVLSSEQARAELASALGAAPGGPAPVLQELPGGPLAAAGPEEQVLQAAAELGLDYTVRVQQAGQSVWDKLRAHQGGAAARS
ncbi:hypothetical protein [Streptomyces sp. NBC_01264]|uniref:hypothetical protein n=1 Tax=Streptomyces sp. NBC_01264 TaxID=2903804 RepID=UPI0022537660|nr:hypothetical protein [Streptomyces sp. NBC_01264]MCX4784191.1 hypothetical protein [Streptomyces sp. NBC_01264]